MEGRLLSEDEPSEPPEHLSHTAQFEAAVPYYLSIGMTPEQFWKGEPGLAKWFRESYRIQKEMRNEEAWIQGMYIYEAFCDAAPLFKPFAKRGTRAIPYPKQPYDFGWTKKKKEKKDSFQEKAKSKMDSFMSRINKNFERREG